MLAFKRTFTLFICFHHRFAYQVLRYMRMKGIFNQYEMGYDDHSSSVLLEQHTFG